MTKVAAFLRAINVGGRRVTNAELVGLVVEAGFGDVSAYQAAGNLLLDPLGASPDDVADRIEGALAEGLGYRSEVFVRDVEDLRGVLAVDPFADVEVGGAVEGAAESQPPARPQVAFLRTGPDAEEVAAILALAGPSDLLAVSGREVHWLPLAGVGRSTLDLAALARITGPLTVRTRGTVERILSRLEG